jgi:hypothetical protein
MLSLRKEIKDYSSSCEHLISAAASADAIPFTQDESDWIKYYAAEMMNLADQLLRNSKPQVRHKRQTIREYAAACEALLLMDGFSEEERDSIRQSVLAITTKILVEKEESALER